MKKNIKMLHRTNLYFFLFAVLFFGFLNTTNAADPEIILTWQADNFFPTTYVGKALPSFGTKIYFSAEMIQDGKLLDTSNVLFDWRKNGERFRQGVGQSEAVVAFNETDRTNFISVSADWNGKQIEKNITLPITQPKLVLEIPYFENIVPKNSDIAITAIPYFFNAKTFNDLSFSWQVGGIKKGTGTNNKLIINTGNPSFSSDQTVLVTGYVQNKRSLLEIIKTPIKIFIGD